MRQNVWMTAQALATPDAARIRRARLGVLALFWLMGGMLATYVSRIPSVTKLLDVTTGRLAVLMLAGAVGALAALTVTGWVVARFGTRAVLFWTSFIYLAAFLTVAWSIHMGSQLWFAIGQFFVSFAFAFTNVAMNAEAANVEHWMRRAVMPHFHASFSIGMATGLAFGALVSHLGVSPTVHFATVAIALTVVRLAIIPSAVVFGVRNPDGAAGGFGGPFKTARDEYRERRIVLIGVIVFAASTIEGAAAQWSSLAVVQAFDTTEAIGDIAYWVFVVAMVTTRGFGAHIIGRAGRVVSLRVSAVLVFVGVLVFAFTPTFWAIPVAMILWGLGAGLGVPIGFSAASDDPRKAAARVAAVLVFRHGCGADHAADHRTPRRRHRVAQGPHRRVRRRGALIRDRASGAHRRPLVPLPPRPCAGGERAVGHFARRNPLRTGRGRRRYP